MKALINNRQLTYLFLCNFSILFIGFGLFPLLPLYAAEFGASQAFIGLYLAIVYVAISVGSIAAAQLSERLPQRSLFIAAGLLGMPALFLLGQARSLWQVVVLTALVWFAGGVGLSISNVLTSLHTNSATRGKVFGALALTSPLGALIGGIVVGWAVEWGGYGFMFSVASAVWSLWPLLALTRVEDKQDCAGPAATVAQSTETTRPPGPVFLLLLLTILLASMTVSVGRMSLSLAMKNQQYSAADVGQANAMGGLVTILIVLLTGTLSDRLGRKRVLAFGYVLAAGGVLMLISAHEPWHFWVVASLVLGSRSVITSMSPAYATDLLRRRFLRRALPLVGTMNWVSGVIGFAGAGYVLDAFGAASLYATVSLLSFLALVIVALLPSSLRPRPTLPIPESGKALQTTGD